MLPLELVTTSEDEKLKDLEGETEYGSAVLRRLYTAYFGTRRVVCADSHFESVQSTEMLLRLGLKLIEVVKTATKSTPWNIFQECSSRKEVSAFI